MKNCWMINIIFCSQVQQLVDGLFKNIHTFSSFTDKTLEFSAISHCLSSILLYLFLITIYSDNK